jgi:hypothetical protein
MSTSMWKNAAFIDPHLPVSYMGDDLNTYLGELWLCEDWLHIFQVYIEENKENNMVAKVLVTPKKQKLFFLSDHWKQLISIKFK